MTINLNKRRVDLLISQSEFKKRRKKKKLLKIDNQTPWQEILEIRLVNLKMVLALSLDLYT